MFSGILPTTKVTNRTVRSGRPLDRLLDGRNRAVNVESIEQNGRSASLRTGLPWCRRIEANVADFSDGKGTICYATFTARIPIGGVNKSRKR